jgi:thiol-disulfide isomerase/thioredoxin
MKKNTLRSILSIFVVILFSYHASAAPSKGAKKPTKDSHGFWINDEESAFKEATKLKKPIFIDFYGIWCPPCNQLDELVFPTKDFKKVADKFVLLKMDADNEKSWILKSKYKVTGYPTMIMAQVDDNQPGAELGRIVGSFPTETFTKKMIDALSSNGNSLDEQLHFQIKQSIDDAENQYDYEKVAKLAEAGLIIRPNDLSLKIIKLSAQTEKDKDFVNKNESKKLLFEANLKKKELSFSDLVKAYNVKPNKELFDEMLSRINPSTLFTDSDGYNEADIYSMGMKLAEAEKNEDMKKTYLTATIESYERLLKKYGQDSRSLNLGYVYYLKENGDNEKVKALLDRLIEKYPGEFTFHFKAAHFFLEKKDFTLAKEHADKALSYAYGDNKIYSMEIVLKVATAQAKESKALKTQLKSVTDQAEDFIKTSANPGELKVRTTRYTKKLAEAITEAKKVLE